MSLTRLGEYIKKKNRQGLAVGQCYIREETIEFVYQDEKFVFPSTDIHEHCKPDGTFYLAKIEKLRELAKE